MVFFSKAMMNLKILKFKQSNILRVGKLGLYEVDQEWEPLIFEDLVYQLCFYQHVHIVSLNYSETSTVKFAITFEQVRMAWVTDV